MKFSIGTKIKFASEKQRYTVQASSDRFTICTKPFNARKTYLYTIIDWKRKVRGPDNLVFGSFEPYNTRDGALANLLMLEEGKMEVSYRRYKNLDIESPPL